MQGELRLLGAEESLEDTYLGPGFRGGKSNGLPIQMLLKVAVNPVCRVHRVTLPFYIGAARGGPCIDASSVRQIIMNAETL
jgi:hypothetical protein